jgi:hypothetical protein
MPRVVRKTPVCRVLGLALLLLLPAACGGGSGGATTTVGAVALEAVWETAGAGGGAQFEGGGDVPAAVQTVEVRIEAAGRILSELVDPDETRRVVLTNVPVGPATVLVLGYDVRLLGVPDVRAVDVAPSFASEPVSILVLAGRTTNAGSIEVLARPFLTDFVPLPEETNVDPATPVRFLLAIAVGEIDPVSTDVAIDGIALVSSGIADPPATFTPCADGTITPCAAIDRGLSGFLFRAPGGGSLPDRRVTVAVRSVGDAGSQRALDFEYGFDTGAGAEGGS